MDFLTGLLDTWKNWLIGASGLLLTRTAWWLWRRRTAQPVPFLGRAIARVFDWIAAILLLGDALRRSETGRMLAEAKVRSMERDGDRKDIQIEEYQKLLATAEMMLATFGVSRRDLELHAGSDASSNLFDVITSPMSLTPTSKALPTSTSRPRARRRRKSRGSGPQTDS